jgi:hypothetical protein
MESALSTSGFYPCGGGYPRVTRVLMVHEQHAMVLAKSSSFGADPLLDLNYPLSKALPIMKFIKAFPKGPTFLKLLLYRFVLRSVCSTQRDAREYSSNM